MRSLKTLVSHIAALALLLCAGTAYAVPTVGSSADAPASAVILKPLGINIVNVEGLVFGRIVPLGGGTVTVSPSEVRTWNGVEVQPSSAYSVSKFLVTGSGGNSFSITLPASTTIKKGGDSMLVNAFTSNPSGTGMLDVSGKADLNVGATLHVNANQPVGNYTGSFSVTVAYN